MYGSVIVPRIAGAIPPTLAVGLVIPLLIVVGIAYPAVWSRQPGRRKAALAVLTQLLRRRR